MLTSAEIWNQRYFRIPWDIQKDLTILLKNLTNLNI